MRYLVTLLMIFGVILPAFAQDSPPLPRPRPDREAIEQTPTNSTEPVEETAQDALARIPDGPPQPLTLFARITEDGPLIPDGLIWRIYGTTANAQGQLDLIDKAETPSALFHLSPGEYLVHVAYGQSQASDTVIVGQEATERTLVLEAGGLRLNAAISGDVPISPTQLLFDVYPSDDERTPIVANARPGEVLHLTAGIYNVISKFGKVNAEVRANLRVEPGQLTDATLYHHAAQISFKLVSEPDGEAIADIDWTVRDSDNAIVFTALGAFPSAILAEGDYTVFARRGETVFNREFQVTPGPGQEIQVLTEVY